MTAVEFLHKGGPIMWLLLACSIIATAVIVDRLTYHIRRRFHFEVFRRQIVKALENGGIAEASGLAGESRHPVARVTAVYLSNLGQPPELARDLLTREGSEALAEASQRLRILATVAQISPLLGLLGTVAGMVEAFATIQSMAGAAQPADLAGGIWEALLTTLAGLGISIPCIAILQYFHSLSETTSHRMEAMIISLDEWAAKTAHRDSVAS